MDSKLHTARPAAGRARSGLTWPGWARWAAVLAWMGLIFFFSDQSNLVLSPDAWWSDPLSWIAHFVEYAVLTLLLWLALRSTPALARAAAPVAFAIAVLYAITDELHQSFVPGRYPDVRDVLVDALGALAALWLARKHLGRR